VNHHFIQLAALEARRLLSAIELSVSDTNLAPGETAQIEISLEAMSPKGTIVQLSVDDTDAGLVDYEFSATQVVIPPGSTTGLLTITRAVDQTLIPPPNQYTPAIAIGINHGGLDDSVIVRFGGDDAVTNQNGTNNNNGTTQPTQPDPNEVITASPAGYPHIRITGKRSDVEAIIAEIGEAVKNQDTANRLGALGTISINVVKDDASFLIGSFEDRAIDIGDLIKCPPALRYRAIVHELVEQNEKQNNGRTWDEAHPIAIDAENGRGDGVERAGGGLFPIPEEPTDTEALPGGGDLVIPSWRFFPRPVVVGASNEYRRPVFVRDAQGKVIETIIQVVKDDDNGVPVIQRIVDDVNSQ
jgi:hypothetical protein